MNKVVLQKSFTRVTKVQLLEITIYALLRNEAYNVNVPYCANWLAAAQYRFLRPKAMTLNRRTFTGQYIDLKLIIADKL